MESLDFFEPCIRICFSCILPSFLPYAFATPLHHDSWFVFALLRVLTMWKIFKKKKIM